MDIISSKYNLIELWQQMLLQSQQLCEVYLDQDLESYLTFLLIRFTSDKTLAQRILGKDLFELKLENNCYNKLKLQEVGDHALLLSGLFPKRASKRQVDLAYYIQIGQSAYSSLAEISHSHQELYYDLAQYFTYLVDVIHALRPEEDMQTLDWLDLWQHTHSKRALQFLNKAFDSQIVLNQSSSNINH